MPGSPAGMDTEIVIRAATVQDARAVGEVFARAFRAGFRDLISAEASAEIGVAERRRAFDAQRAGDDADSYRTWVAVADDGTGPQVVGFVDSRPSPDETPTTTGRVGEVHALYLLQGYWGRGIGRTLLARAIDDLETRGFTAVTLWSLRGNARARRLYGAAGMRPDGGEKIVEAAGSALPHLRYRLSLPRATP